MAEGVKIAARNQKAFHEYFIDEKFEAGIELTGTEVKSIRLGTLSLKEAWCQIKDGQLYIRQMHIAPYEQGNIFNKDPLRSRRLLMHKREIFKLFSKVKESEADAEIARQSFQARVDAMADDTTYPEEAGMWKNNATVTVNGNYVVLEVLPDGCTVPDAFLAKF